MMKIEIKVDDEHLAPTRLVVKPEQYRLVDGFSLRSVKLAVVESFSKF